MNLQVLSGLSKTVFLAFVIVLATYIMYTNKVQQDDGEKKEQAKAHVIEHYNEPKTEPLSTRIKSVYKGLYGTEPNEQELTFYLHFFKGKDADKAYMKDMISTSAPTLQKVLKTGAMPTLDSGEGTEQEVIAVYNQLLDRNPDPVELEYYAGYIKQGPEFLEKMKIQLIGSPEYKSHQKMQDNKAYSGYLGGITERQLEYMITKVYKEVNAGSEDIDEETMAFLRKKFLEFEANDAVFRKFVKDFVLYKPEGTTTPKTTSTMEKFEEFTVHPSKKSAPRVVSEASQTSMARFVNQRNRDELKNICERNSAYSKYHDEDLVVTPGYKMNACVDSPKVPLPNDPMFARRL